MKVVHLEGARSYEPEPDWRRASLCAEEVVSVEYFVKPPGHASPLHAHPEAQVCIVVRGRMRAVAQGREELLGEGDAAYFEGGEPHSIVNDLDEPSVGIDVFAPGRSFDFWLGRRP
jgi:quercetin dioxygenase-like cupin family protein